MSAKDFGSVPLTLLAASFYFYFTEVKGKWGANVPYLFRS
jgi:hypothetical protein